jgi:hypothetical protein
VRKRTKEGEKNQKHEDRGSDIVKIKYIIRGNYPLPLMSKGKRKIRAHEDKGSNGHRESMSIYIDAKQGDCWKVGFH